MFHGTTCMLKENMQMRVVVDLNRCQGYAQCCFLAPEAFKLIGEEALIYNSGPDDEQSEKILRAAAACPVQAIFVERTNGHKDELKKSMPAQEEAYHGK